ncbi:MAG: flagellar hook-length control protein FliK [Sulfurospirillum sp.]|jgi:hypothetical protein|nr:flagellar hook-length control protein FliK [Sulfurospirillum sp.]
MKEILTISVGSNVAQTKSVKESKTTQESEGSSSKDFLSLMVSQLKSNSKVTTTDTKNLQENILQNEEESSELTNLDAPKKSLDEHLLTEVLEVISLLKNETPKTSFPKYSTKIEQLLSDEVALKEFKEVKNIADLMSLSKKYDLGLEKLSIKKVDFETIKNEFPTLDKKAFFEVPKESEKEVKNTFLDTSSKKTEIKSSEIPFNAIEKPVKNTQKEQSIFEKIITKEIKEEKTIQTTKESLHVKEEKIEIKQKTEKDAEIKTTQNTKEVPKEISTIAKEAKDKKEEKISQTKVTTPQDDTQEAVLKETPKTTRTNEVKVESALEKKGLSESVLQNIKNEKSEQQKTLASQPALSSENTNTKTTENENGELKNESINTIKNDVKVNSKQDFSSKSTNNQPRETFSTFADDLREKIEQYKPPIMKVQMALNPKALGEVDVTIINRGNNLHVSITSNTNTMTLFTQNQAEFKNSLVNMGFTNLEMNFSDQRQSNNEQSKNSSSANKDFFEEVEEETNTSIELIVPQYV